MRAIIMVVLFVSSVAAFAQTQGDYALVIILANGRSPPNEYYRTAYDCSQRQAELALEAARNGAKVWCEYKPKKPGEYR
jgi:hypothetical protein